MLKRPLNYDEQIKRLKSHNISVSDPVLAKKILSRIGYYRLSGYALQFRKASDCSDCVDGTSFDSIYLLYCFDEDLRQILRPYLERTEVYYKAQIAHVFSLRKCLNPPHDQHYDRNNYYNKGGFDSIISGFRSREAGYYRDSLILQHHIKKYNGELPIWVLLELLSFSGASMLYSAMYYSDQQAVADAVGVSRGTLLNHLHALSILRNKCAHGARLYNTKLNPPVRFNSTFLKKHPDVRDNSVFSYILVLLRRLPDVDSKRCLKDDIDGLILKYSSDVDMSKIGFPKDYADILQNSII